MNLDWLNEFQDPYLQKPTGKGIFLSGIALGFIASCQKGKSKSIADAPLFKKLPFGKLQKRDIKRQLADIPVMLKAYEIPYPYEITNIANAAGELLLTGSEEMGIDGNFIFSLAFLNAWKYFYLLYPDHQKKDQNQMETMEENHEF